MKDAVVSKLMWSAHRLKSMSPAEIGWRASRVAGDRLDDRRGQGDRRPPLAVDWPSAQAAFREAENRPVLLDRTRARAIAAAEPKMVDELLLAAHAAVDLRFAYFGYPEVRLSQPVDWNLDPLAGVRWPDLPAARIDHRSAGGDVKWIWELNRLQHLPWLAQAWLITGDDVFSEAAFCQLDSWLVQNPPGRGIAWRGAFEAGIRAISVAIALQALRDSPALTPERYRRVLSMLAESARRCWAKRSLFSSANNHLVGELAGLATVAILHPELSAAGRWERRAVEALVLEADRQILPDGTGAEQAVGYQVFTAELMLIVERLLCLRDGSAPAALTDAVSRSAGFLSSVVGDADPAPRYGDDDEGFAIRLGPEPVRTVREHLGMVGSVLRQPGLVARATPSLTALWLGREGTVRRSGSAGPLLPEDSVSPVDGPAPGNLYAHHGGLVVLRAGNRRVTMDVGPLGFLSIAAHGHADALSVTLSNDGVDLIGDPGAGSYYRDPDLRRVHRGTRAHATVLVDGVDQSVIGGPFLWTRQAQVQVRAVDLAAGVVDAQHDGYTRLPSPVRHRRWLIAPPDEAAVVVVDLLTGSGVHRGTVSWPLAPGLRPRACVGGFWIDQVDGAGLQICFAATVDVTADEMLGEQDSQLGWWSERLEKPVPSSLLGVHGSGELPIAFATLLRPGGDGEPIDGLDLNLSSDAVEVCWRSGSRVRRIGLELAGNAVKSNAAGL